MRHRTVLRSGLATLALGLLATGPGAGQIIVDDAVVETQADAPCYSAATGSRRDYRYLDCGNGTVLDTVTGLVWRALANCLGFPPNNGARTWWQAIEFAQGLKHGVCLLTDHSQPGDWRLPTVTEWQLTVARAKALGCKASVFARHPTLTNDTGTSCLTVGPTSFLIAPADYNGQFWALESDPVAPGGAGVVQLHEGFVLTNWDKDLPSLVWAVRRPDR